MVKEYIAHCPSCSRNKTSKKKTTRELQPIDAPGNNYPTRAFESINMDLIVNLPKSGQYDAVLVIVSAV